MLQKLRASLQGNGPVSREEVLQTLEILVRELSWEGRLQQGFTLFTDFFSDVSQGFRSNASGTSALGNSGGVGSPTVPGTGGPATGTTNTGYGHFGTFSTALDLAGGLLGTWLFGISNNLTSLNDGTDNWTVRVGFFDSVSSAAVVDGVYFEYNSSSANWQLITSANSVQTVVDSGRAVAATREIQQIVIENGAAKFYVQGTLVGTITTNIPNGSSQLTGAGVAAIKTLGTNNRTTRTDWMLLKYRPLSPMRTTNLISI